MLSNYDAFRKARNLRVGTIIWHGEPGLLQPGTVTLEACEGRDGLCMIGIDYHQVFCEFVHKSPGQYPMSAEFGGSLGCWLFDGKSWTVSGWKRVQRKIEGRIPGECWRRYWQSAGKKSVCAADVYAVGGRVTWSIFDKRNRVQREGSAETVKGAALRALRALKQFAASEVIC